MVKAILDKCVFGDRLVVTNMLEDDIHHNSLPTCKSFIEDPEAHVSSLFYLGSHHNYVSVCYYQICQFYIYSIRLRQHKSDNFINLMPVVFSAVKDSMVFS